MMLIESMEEGRIEWNEETEVIDRNELLNVGTALGKIDDGDDDGDEEEWTWQAYLHDDIEGESQTENPP